MSDLRKIKSVIDSVPKNGIPELLSCIIKNAVQKKAFGEKSLGEIVASLEKAAKGQLASSGKEND